MSRKVIITPEAAGKRLDVALAELTGLTRSQIQKAIAAGLVSRSGETVKNKLVTVQDEVYILTDAATPDVPPIPDLKVVFQDSDIVVVDKPAGLAVHLGESQRPQPTVAAFAASLGIKDTDASRPGIVHRLDKDTSGLMVISRNPEAKAALQHQFKSRTVGKKYLALVRGRLTEPQAVISLPIARSRTSPQKRSVLPGGRQSKTEYKVVKQYQGASLVEVQLHTGRTHQIRVHFSHLGHPIIGDSLYGEKNLLLPRQFLHAAELSLQLPSGQNQSFTSKLPADLRQFLDQLEKGIIKL